MRIQSLKHLAEVVQATARPERIIVFGSSSLLSSHPELGEPGEPLESSFDADFLVEPCSEDLARMLDEAVGENRRFHAMFGYYADFLRPAIVDSLPRNWEERLIPLSTIEHVFCLEPHDLAVAKLHAGRRKDIDLLVVLLKRDLLCETIIRERLAQTSMRESLIVKTHQSLDQVLRQAAEYGRR